MTGVEQRLQALEDREAIRDLIARYGPLADCGAAQDVAALWTETGSYGVAGFADASGRAEIAALIDAPYHQQLMADGCAHLLGPVAIELAGDHATARGHSIVLRWTGAAFEVLRVAANRWNLTRIDGCWQVTRRDNALLQGDAAARELLRP